MNMKMAQTVQPVLLPAAKGVMVSVEVCQFIPAEVPAHAILKFS